MATAKSSISSQLKGDASRAGIKGALRIQAARCNSEDISDAGYLEHPGGGLQ
jgi:hypothetical protein